MVQDLIKVSVEKEELPKAPWIDEEVIQHIIDEKFVDELTSPRIEIQKKILLGSLRDGKFKVEFPISVNVTYENEQVIVEAEEINEFGFGENISVAIADLQRAIVELYLTLEKEQDRLGEDLKKVWGILQKKILKK